MKSDMENSKYIYKTNSSKDFFDKFFRADSFEDGFTNLAIAFKIDISAFSDEEVDEYHKAWNVKNRKRKIESFFES